MKSLSIPRLVAMVISICFLVVVAIVFTVIQLIPIVTEQMQVVASTELTEQKFPGY